VIANPQQTPKGIAPIMPVIDFHKQTIGKILMDKKNLRVPINQRPYAWEHEHVNDLYQDLNGAIGRGDEEYFLGSVIIVAPKGADCIEVYDGQQRLATSMILIAAIRDFFYANGDKEGAANIERESLYSPERKTNTPRPHLTLSADDNTFFVNRVLLNPDHQDRKNVKPDPKKLSHDRIVKAAETAEEHVGDITRKLQASDQINLLHK